LWNNQEFHAQQNLKKELSQNRDWKFRFFITFKQKISFESRSHERNFFYYSTRCVLSLYERFRVTNYSRQDLIYEESQYIEEKISTCTKSSKDLSCLKDTISQDWSKWMSNISWKANWMKIQFSESNIEHNEIEMIYHIWQKENSSSRAFIQD
jgi:hypothetical protein